MDENQQNIPAPGTDPEWEKIQKQTPGLKDQVAEKKEVAAPIEKKEEKKPEPAAPKEEEKKSAEDTSEDDEGKEDEEDKTPLPKKPSRPEKYIPVKQYTDEKKSWRETEEQLKKRVSELEAIAVGKEGTKVNDDAIKKYAEKHELDLEDARKEVERIRDIVELGGDPKPKDIAPKTAELSEEQKQSIKEAEQFKAEKAFNAEYSTLAVPELKTLYPDATPEQLEKAKVEIEKLACTKKFLDKSLDFVVYKNRETLDSLFVTKPGGIEGTRQAPSKEPVVLSAADFKGGKTSFDVMSSLPSEQQAKIIDDMDVPTYDKFVRWMNKNSKPEINRGGKKI